MNDLEMLNNIKRIETELEQRILTQQQEEEERTDRAPYYRFVYLQLMDTGEWLPNDHLVQAATVARAFASFGYFLQTMKLKVRDIRYGLEPEMHEEREAIRSYWDKQIKP